MRVGSNPNRRAPLPQRNTRVAAAITHLPNQDGYHAQRLRVVQVSLLSMAKNLPGNVDILVWDNGSCAALTDWLREEFKPDTLILSANIGKSSARASIFKMQPPDNIIALADDDMLYYPGWWEAQEKILTTYPNVGAVSGYPVRTQARWGNKSTLAWAEKNGKIETGRFIPDEWERDFCTSIGRDPEFHQRYTLADKDRRIKYKGVPAYLMAHHCQFMAYAGRLAPLTEFNQQATSNEQDFDIAVDNAGYLRLTTTKRYTRHIGNVLDEDIAKAAVRMEVAVWA